MNRNRVGDLAITACRSETWRRAAWRWFVSCFACVVYLSNAFAQEANEVTSTSIPNHQEINRALEEFIAAHEIAGAVAGVVEKDRLLHLSAAGNAKLGSAAHPDSEPMIADSIFWIASMSKPVTGVSIRLQAAPTSSWFSEPPFPTRTIRISEKPFNRSQRKSTNTFRDSYFIG